MAANIPDSGNSFIPPLREHSITKVKASDAIGNFKNAIQKLSKADLNSDVTGGTFHVKAILSIVNRNDCAGVRFYFAKNSNNEPTIVVIGVDINGKDILDPKIDDRDLDAGFENSWPYPQHGARPDNLLPA